MATATAAVPSCQLFQHQIKIGRGCGDRTVWPGYEGPSVFSALQSTWLRRLLAALLPCRRCSSAYSSGRAPPSVPLASVFTCCWR